MVRFLDKNRKPLVVGDHVEIRHLVGKYGQTQTVRGVLKELNEYGGVYIVVDAGTPQFSEDMGRFGTRPVTGGDRYYVCNEYDFKLAARVGHIKSDDFEHGYEGWCVKLDEPAPEQKETERPKTTGVGVVSTRTE